MMDTRSDTSWQQSTGALIFLCSLFALVMAWCWIASWPLAVSGHEGATENLVTIFAAAALGISLLSAGYKRPMILTIGASLWALAFYLSSLFLDEMVQGHNVGTAIRVGALSALSFALAAAYLMRKAR